MKILTSIACCALALVGQAGAFSPQPSSVTLNGGDFSYGSGARIFYETRTVPRAVESTLLPLAEVLAGELEMVTGIKPAVVWKTAETQPGVGDISLEFGTVSGSFAASEEDEDQSYTLEVADAVTIESSYFKGVAYGTVTLLQSVVEDAASFFIPKMSVADAAASGYRTVMVDVARQPSGIGTIKEVVRLARQYKLRYLQLHLTDDQNFTFPFTPVTGNLSGNFTYSRAELNDLVAYADARGVTIVPEFDLPGHSGKLRDSGYLDPGDSDWDVADPANYDEIQAIIDDMLSVFVSTPYFHIGGDESGAGSRLVPFLEAMNDHLRGTPEGGKRRMLVWEGFYGAPTTELPATGDDRIIVLSWESSYNAPWDLLNAGYEVVNASWKPLYVVGSGATYRYPHTTQRMWEPEVLHSWDKDTFMHWEPGRPVFEDRGPNDSDLDDGVWNAAWISKQEQVIGGQMLSWEQNEKSIVTDLLPRLPVMADRLWNPQAGEDYAAFETRLDAVSERALMFVRPVEILPLSEVDNSPLNQDYRTYRGSNVSITLRNRTKIPGTIRYELGGFNNSLGAANFDLVPDTTSSSTPYSGPFNRSGGFGIRAGLYRLDDGTLVDGHDLQHFNNWDNRVRITEYEVSRRPLGSVPDFASWSNTLVTRVYDMPILHGPYIQEKAYGQKFDATLQVPESGSFDFQMQTRDGRSSFYLDLNQNGVWDDGEKVIADTDASEVKKYATVTLAAGDYRFRVDHASGAIAPVIILKIDGPGTGGSKDVSGFLKLPVDLDSPPTEPRLISPPDGSDGVLHDAELRWSSEGSSGYEVYFWMSGENKPTAPTASVLENLWNPESLEYETTYFWQVVSSNSHGSSAGEEWSFTTGDETLADGVLLLHEEFDGYTQGSIDGQTAQGLGLAGDWSGNGNGDYVITSGLSGDNALKSTAGLDNELRVGHHVAGWGSGQLWMSYLYNEESYGGHTYVSGGGDFDGGAGHPWINGTFGLQNATNPGFSYSKAQTYRLVTLLDWDANTTTLWVDPEVDPVTGGTPHAAQKIGEVPDPNEVLFFTTYNTVGTFDDIRIGTSFHSVVANVDTGTSYADWAVTHGASSDPNDDSNHNGVPNGVEFFMGGTLASPATLPALLNNGGRWTWTIPYDVRANASWEFQSSADLVNWTDFQGGDPETRILTDPDEIEFTLPAVGDVARGFCRLLVGIQAE